MGLDMYAYVAEKAGQQREYYETSEFNEETREYGSATVDKPREIAYWRKHPNLHGWMHQLWIQKGFAGDFNGDELELTWDDIEQLEQAIKNKELPGTSGFFFGNDADEHYYEDDLQFVRAARAELFLGLRVFYNSSW
jgi:hypothetical protein